MLSFLLLLSSLVLSVAADGYVCSGGRLINPPEDNVYYYPEDWRDGQKPAKYAPNQNCEWQINVLPGWYAKVVFNKDTDMESGITTTYPNGQVQYIEDKQLNPYIFTGPQFKVNLQVYDKQGMFSFKVIWEKYPPRCQMNIELENQQPMAGYAIECYTTFKAPNKAMLVGFTLQDDSDVLLRQSAIFEGDSFNGKYLGNLYYARYNQIVSDSKELTVFTWDLYKNFNYTLFMGLDVQAAGDVEQFQGVNCPSDKTKQCNIYLNAESNISAVAMISRNTDYIRQILTFPAESTLKIYEGKISPDALVATVNRSNFMNEFPMGVKNSLKIYHLDKGRVVLPLARTAVEANNGIVFDGRVINVHSFDYQRTSYFQDTSEVYSTYNKQEKLYFKFQVNHADFNPDTTLTLTILRDGSNVFNQIFSKANPPPSYTLKVYGDQMTINYMTYGNYTTGFQMDLNTVKNENGSSSQTTSQSTFPTTSIRTSPSVTSTVISIATTTATPDSSTPAPSVDVTTGTTPRGTAAPGGSTRTVETTTKSASGKTIVLSFILFFMFILKV